MARILVVSPTSTHPQNAGNRARIFSLLSALQAAGHQVYLVLATTESGDEEAMMQAWDGLFTIPYRTPTVRWLKRQYDRMARRLKTGWVLPYRIDDLYTPEISRRLDEISREVRPEVVIVEYVFLSRAFECFGPGILKVLDTHDIFGGRHLMYRRNRMAPQWFYTSAGEEKKALDRADVVLAIQDKEAAILSRMTSHPVLVVGHLAQASAAVSAKDELANRLLFVGSSNSINVDAMNWFLSEVFSIVRRRLPAVELEIVGDCAERIPAVEGLILVGHMDDLAPCYRRAAVVINPVRFGTGLKIKTIEALAHGRPLVSTGEGAAGLEEWADKAFLRADTAEEFAGKILEVLGSGALRTMLSGKALEFIREYNRAAMRPLLESIDRAAGTSTDLQPNFSGRSNMGTNAGNTLIRIASKILRLSMNRLGTAEDIRKALDILKKRVVDFEDLLRRKNAAAIVAPDIASYDGKEKLAVSIMSPGAPWLKYSFPEESIPAMISDEEKQYYTYLMRFYSGQGEVVELGPWLGASTYHLIEALKGNPNFEGRKLHVYDDFVWRPDWMDSFVGEAERQPRHSDFRAKFEHYVGSENMARMQVHKVKICNYDGNESLPLLSWSGEPIELLIVDCGRTFEVNQAWFKVLSPSFIPGCTLIVMLDWRVWREVPEKWFNQTRQFTDSKFGLLRQLHEVRSGAVATFLYTGEGTDR